MKTDEKTAAYCQQVTDYLVARIEAGADDASWVAPWHYQAPAALAPYNPTTKAHYTGGNAIGLWLTSQMLGAPNEWATFKQWQTIGAQVKKGEHAMARALRPMSRTIEDKETGDKLTRTVGFTSFAVFHAGQVDGYEPAAAPELPTIATEEAEQIDAAYRWVRRVGAKLNLVAAGRAFYSPALDSVTLPTAELWTSSDAAWSTAAHELTHWTGHESRLNRDKAFGHKFGSDGYAMEELCAELGAAMILAGIGRHSEPRDDHAQYLANWLKALKADPTALFTVAAKSQAACSYVVAQTDTIGIAA